ncbi:type II toxin-antitoxin system PemK/MazF family toxin [Planotetraspora sp. A-T 1434]|uniref:type II toxin-antitoxin system PemK/MazF family toxin n=1 Tax=Planotetraspora sp. A-T 1434 TaxID=2979219 RepID=UPI0021BE64C1|nr:type II toxin-antitoxin system PemK/MazF family toxin [Planotetraspora sp. A-T 1434]MCT9932983.1 type II toxin-antitoxin system PemK/MazF family toxin [Planotetraspora sp. A-T 1434]
MEVIIHLSGLTGPRNGTSGDLPTRAKDSKAQAEQVRSIAPGRLRERIGHLPAPVLKKLDEALRTHLAL